MRWSDHCVYGKKTLQAEGWHPVPSTEGSRENFGQVTSRVSSEHRKTPLRPRGSDLMFESEVEAGERI